MPLRLTQFLLKLTMSSVLSGSEILRHPCDSDENHFQTGSPLNHCHVAGGSSKSHNPLKWFLETTANITTSLDTASQPQKWIPELTCDQTACQIHQQDSDTNL